MLLKNNGKQLPLQAAVRHRHYRRGMPMLAYRRVAASSAQVDAPGGNAIAPFEVRFALGPRGLLSLRRR